MHGFGRKNTEFFFQYICNTTLTGLAVDADELFVIAANIPRIDVQIRDLPALIEELADLFAPIHTFADGILMAAGKSGKDQFARIGVTAMHINTRSVFHRIHDLGQVGKIQTRRNTAAVQIHRQHQNIQVAGTFAVAENGPFGAFSTRQQSQFAGSHRTALIVMGVDTDGGFVHIGIIADKVFDHIRILVRRTAFHSGGQVQNKVRLGGFTPGFLDLFTDFDNKVQIAVGKFFGRKFIGNNIFHPGRLHIIAHHTGTIDRHLHNLIVVAVEHKFAVQIAGRHIAVDDRLFDTVE